MDRFGLRAASFCEQCGLHRDQLGDETVAPFRECADLRSRRLPELLEPRREVVPALRALRAPARRAGRRRGRASPGRRGAPVVEPADPRPGAAKRGKRDKAADAWSSRDGRSGRDRAARPRAARPTPVGPGRQAGQDQDPEAPGAAIDQGGGGRPGRRRVAGPLGRLAGAARHDGRRGTTTRAGDPTAAASRSGRTRRVPRPPARADRAGSRASSASSSSPSHCSAWRGSHSRPSVDCRGRIARSARRRPSRRRSTPPRRPTSRCRPFPSSSPPGRVTACRSPARTGTAGPGAPGRRIRRWRRRHAASR